MLVLLYVARLVHVFNLRVLARVVVIKDNLNDIVFLEDKCLSISAIYGGIGCVGTGAHYSVKGRNFWRNIGDTVEESTARVSLCTHHGHR